MQRQGIGFEARYGVQCIGSELVKHQKVSFLLALQTMPASHDSPHTMAREYSSPRIYDPIGLFRLEIMRHPDGRSEGSCRCIASLPTIDPPLLTFHLLLVLLFDTMLP
jgi:hypothetical protein